MKKRINKTCINCDEYYVYNGAEQFADYGDLCIQCYYELKIANLRQEIKRSTDEALLTIHELIDSVNKATVQLDQDRLIIEAQKKLIDEYRKAEK